VIIDLADLAVKVITLRHKTILERRVEIVPTRGGDPLISLTPGEAYALGWILRARAREAEEDHG
jgi:hypothetical protein